MTRTSTREQIVALKNAGFSDARVTKQLNVCRKTIFNVMKRFKVTGGTADKAIPGRKKSVRVNKVIEAVRKRISRNPRRSMRQMARSMHISENSMRRIVKTDIGMKSYKMSRRHLISPASKQKRLVRSKRMLKEMEDAGGKAIVWSDEKMFTVETAANKQNDRVLSVDSNKLPEDVKHHFRRQKPASVMVWAAVGSDGSKSPLVFIDQGVKVNSEVYVKMLEEKVLPWLQKTYRNGYVFTQDGAPAHTAAQTQAWCTENLSSFWSKEMWPPSSPDLNPMDFSIWAVSGEHGLQELPHQVSPPYISASTSR